MPALRARRGGDRGQRVSIGLANHFDLSLVEVNPMELATRLKADKELALIPLLVLFSRANRTSVPG